MFRSNTRNTTAGILGIALAGLALSNSAFAMQPLSQGYMLAAGDAAGKNNATTGKATKPVTAKKTAEGKCGEGKCGGSI